MLVTILIKKMSSSRKRSKNPYNLSEKELREVEKYLSESIDEESYGDESDGSFEEEEEDFTSEEHRTTSGSSYSSSAMDQDSIIRIKLDEEEVGEEKVQHSKEELDEIVRENEDIRKLNIFLSVVQENKEKCFDDDDASEINKRIEFCEENIRKIDKKKDVYKHINVLEKKLRMRELVLDQVSKIIDMENKHKELHTYMIQKNETMKTMLNEMKQIVSDD